MGRAILAVCITAVVLVRAEGATAQIGDIKDFAAQRAERKKAASDGKIPLPGTPDLARLEARLTEKGVPTDAPIVIRIFKAESELEIWTGDEAGNYALFATYPICFWSGTLGPKLKEGDRQAPEGFYTVTLPQTAHQGRHPKSLDLEFPNPFDQVSQRNGSAILIHGGCASIGCFAMTNAVNLEVHKLTVAALEAGQPYVPVHVFPFRMTEQNLAAYASSEWSGFWRNLKEGYDLFERTQRPPRVTVCGTRYGFEAASRLEGANPGPIRVCPDTAQMIADLSHINTRVAEEKVEVAPAKVASIIGPASYLGGPTAAAAGTIANKLAENYEQQVAPTKAHPGVSPLLTRSLPCSLALPSCRRYAALREQLAQKASLRLDEPERQKASAPKKKSVNKRKSSGRRYSEYRGEVREYGSSARYTGEDRQWREFRSSRY
jgi:murein L,D-transpeptidase YafK